MSLAETLKAHGIDPDFDKWRDSQQFGIAVREALAKEREE